MAATPKNGTIILQGVSGREYSLSIYCSDVANAAVTFSTTGSAGTGSQNFYIIPENCVLKDVSLVTGMADTTALVPYINDVPSGALVSIANAINTLAYRAIPKLGFAAGRKLTIIQAA